MEQSPSTALTDDDRRAVVMLCLGYSEQRMARDLRVSVSTVRRRLRAAAHTLGARNRPHLAALATRLGLIADDEWSDSLRDQNRSPRDVGADEEIGESIPDR